MFSDEAIMIKIICLIIAEILIVLVTLWGFLALLFCAPATGLNIVLSVIYGLSGLLTFICLSINKWNRQVATGFVVIFVILVAWWNTIKPSNDRDWQTDVAILPYTTINGDLVTVYNIRNFDYRSEYDYVPAYYDKTFDMRKLESVDLVAVYWMGPAIAHTFLTFGFNGGDYLAVSIETRKEKGEAYSTLRGFFKQYELYYVVADERDVIRLRTNYRKDPPEDVYLYRIYRPVKNGQRTFLEYMEKINALNKQPQFYNTLLYNCTTTIWYNAKVNPGRVPFSWKVLVSGYAPEYLYEMGVLDTSIPFAELQRRNHVNARAQQADKAPDFSSLIRTVD